MNGEALGNVGSTEARKRAYNCSFLISNLPPTCESIFILEQIAFTRILFPRIYLFTHEHLAHDF